MIWDISTLGYIGALRAHQKDGSYSIPITSMNSESSIVPRCQRLLFTGGKDGVVKGWSIATMKCVVILRGHTGDIRFIELSPECVFSGGSDFTVRVYDRTTFECVQILNHPCTITDGITFDSNFISATHDRMSKFQNFKNIFLVIYMSSSYTFTSKNKKFNVFMMY